MLQLTDGRLLGKAVATGHRLLRHGARPHGHDGEGAAAGAPEERVPPPRGLLNHTCNMSLGGMLFAERLGC